MQRRNRTNKQKSALKEKLIFTALASKELLENLEEAALEINAGASKTATEASIAGYFERILYAELRDIGIKFHPEKEVYVHGIRHSGKGRTDARLGAVVIEYKKPSRLKTDKLIAAANKQLADYMKTLTDKEHSTIYGFLTDGRKCCELVMNNEVLASSSPVQKLTGSVLLRLTKSIVSLDLAALSTENLIRDFCGLEQQGMIFETARVLFKVLTEKAAPKTKMLRSEWEEIFRLGHNDRSQQKRIEERRKSLSEVFRVPLGSSEDEYRGLFCLHTAYALVVKLVAYRVVEELGFKKKMVSWSDLTQTTDLVLRTFCAELEDGVLFRKIGILNLLEGDFFSWYTDKGQWNSEIGDSIRGIVTVLGRYEQTANLFSSEGAVDLFRELYEATIPQPVRSSFGEFYTPRWLAQAVIDAATPKGRWRLLDPCSGSGTFIIAAIELLRRENAELDRDSLLTEVLDRVVAFDLNPLAVMTTRVNYFIHIAELIGENVREFVIPVFLGDASNTPRISKYAGVECVSFRLSTLKDPIEVTLPLSLVKQTTNFVKLMLNYEAAVKSTKQKKAVSILLNALEREKENQQIVELIDTFTARLIELERNGWNGIWARILMNLLTTVAIPRFSVIVGNPPWIDWKNLPEGYREKIKSICLDRGLFSGAGRTGGINLNICALIAHVSINNWLSKDGRLAFLMPRELAIQPSYEGWRKLRGSIPRKFVKFEDWTKSGHPFDPVKEDFMTYVIGLGDARKSDVPCFRYIKNEHDRTKARLWKTLEEAKQHLKCKKSVAGQIMAGSTAFTFAENRTELRKFSQITGECPYIGREGIEFYPQELLLFRYESAGPLPGTVFLRNIQVAKSKYKIPTRSILLETKYLFPLVKGSNISEFKHSYDGIIVPFPYEAADPQRPISIEDLEKKSRLLLSFYQGAEDIMRSQTEFSDKIRGPNAGEFYGLARTGAYSFAKTYVCFRDNSKWCAAVVTDTEMPWGEVRRFVFQNHAVSMCERKDRSFMTADECHYVCAILNTPIVKRFIYASSDERSFKIRPSIFIPVYRKGDKRHKRLSKISKEIHLSPERREELASESERIYIEICNKEELDKKDKNLLGTASNKRGS